MDRDEMKRLGENWIKNHYAPKSKNESGPFSDAWWRLEELVRKDPERAWEIIHIIRALDTSEGLLGHLAAGPLEELFAEHGAMFIDRAETLARQDSTFKKLLGAVWRNSIDEAVWARLRAIAGPSF